jgi:hypothetical protein
MAVYSKVNDSWIDTLKAISYNTWLSQNTRKSITVEIESGISEEDAEELCNKYNLEIECSIGLWQAYQ